MGVTIVIVGNLGNDPELRYTQTGTAVCNFNVAVKQGFGEHQSTLWTRVTVWGDAAEAMCSNLAKGSKVEVIASRVEINTWQSQDGKLHGQLQVTADRVEFHSPKPKDTTPANDEQIPF